LTDYEQNRGPLSEAVNWARPELAARGKANDAYDICFALQNFPGGMEEVVKAFRPHLKLGLVQDGLKKMAGKFASLDHVGPRDVAGFEATLDEEERAIRQRNAFEKVNYLPQQLAIV